MSKPDLSVIVCCYNGKSTIRKCLKSLINQNLGDFTFEVILVDDGSRDGTDKEIKLFLKNNNFTNSINFYYFRKKNEGLSVARNFGAAKAKSDLIAYIDEDAEAEKLFVSNLICAFKKNEKINCIGGKVEILNSQNEIANLIQNSVFAWLMKQDNVIIGTNMAFRKDFLKKIGGFQREFIYRGDETALLEKAGDKLNALKVDSVIVKHEQPETLSRWFQIRYENGYFRAAIDKYIDKSSKFIFIRNFKALFSLLFPFILIAIYIMEFPMLSLIFGVCLYVAYFVMRFIWKGFIPHTINEYCQNINKVKVKDLILIVYMIIVGRYIADFGYLRGFLVYRNQVWRKSNFAS